MPAWLYGNHLESLWKMQIPGLLHPHPWQSTLPFWSCVGLSDVPIIFFNIPNFGGFPDSSTGKESTCNAEDAGDVSLIQGSGRSPGGWKGNPRQYSWLENSMDREAWRATVHRVAKSWTRLSTHMWGKVSEITNPVRTDVSYKLLNIRRAIRTSGFYVTAVTETKLGGHQTLRSLLPGPRARLYLPAFLSS